MKYVLYHLLVALRKRRGGCEFNATRFLLLEVQVWFRFVETNSYGFEFCI